MGYKRKRKDDEDVIKTEPDKRRATGKDDENDFEEEEARLAPKPVWGLTSVREILDRKNVLRKIHKRHGETEFPFLKLPAEIRNMIYRYLLVSQAHELPHRYMPGGAKSPISIGAHLGCRSSKYWYPGGIETAILTVNRQIYSEASRILYTENKFKANVTEGTNFIDFRVDEAKTLSMDTRSLRYGRKVDMVKHSGLIYNNVVRRLRNLEICLRMPPHYDGHWGYHYGYVHNEYTVYSQLEKLAELVVTRGEQPGQVDDLSVYGKNWVVKLECSENVGLVSLKIMLHPIMNAKFMKMLRETKLAFHIEGKMPKGWKKVMQMLLDNGATVGKITEIKPAAQDVFHGYRLLAHFRGRYGKLVPRSAVLDEAAERAGVRRCRNCLGLHAPNESFEGEGEDSDDDEYDYSDWDEY